MMGFSLRSDLSRSASRNAVFDGLCGSTQPGAYTANGNPTTQVLGMPADATETFLTTPVIYP